ncbi:hypothetical protein C3733_08685 [Bacillus amyloliquefaciens]|nr:hypothetical protein C3733_08685 [Bacillus amyloliquefaciens]
MAGKNLYNRKRTNVPICRKGHQKDEKSFECMSCGLKTSHSLKYVAKSSILVIIVSPRRIGPKLAHTENKDMKTLKKEND